MRDAMQEPEQPSYFGIRLTPDSSKVLLSFSTQALAWAVGGLIVLGGVVFRFGLASYQGDISAIRSLQATEVQNRIDLEIRISQLEKHDIKSTEQLARVNEIMMETKSRVEAHQRDGHGGHDHEYEYRERRKR